MKKLTLVILGVLFFNVHAFAVGDAGCGLGSLIWKNNTKLTQLFATTTNGTFGSQTFGITTGTSNCSAHGLVQVNKEEVYFAEANFKPLTIEMAQGKGENLNAFASVLGCKEGSAEQFGTMTRTHYNTIVPTEKTTPFEMLNAVKKQLQSDPVLAKDCNVVS